MRWKNLVFNLVVAAGSSFLLIITVSFGDSLESGTTPTHTNDLGSSPWQGNIKRSQFESKETERITKSGVTLKFTRKLEKKTAGLESNAAVVANWSTKVTSCSGTYENILCATPVSVHKYAQLTFLKDLKNPCVCISRENSPRGVRVTAEKVAVHAACRLRCLPYIYLMGFSKCGTTDMHVLLTKHQLIEQGYRKEIEWWSRGKAAERRFWRANNITSPLNLFSYMNMFKYASSKIKHSVFHMDKQLTLRASSNTGNLLNEDYRSNMVIIESSISNGISDHIYQEIHHLNPNAKLLYMLRDPVERAFSAYRFSFQISPENSIRNQTPAGFHNFIATLLNKDSANRMAPKLLTTSHYADKIKGPMQLFGKSNVKIIRFEDYIVNPVSLVEEELLPFFGLPRYDRTIRENIANTTTSKISKNTSYLKYEMLPETRKLLQDYFKPHNVQLSKLLGDNKWTWGY